MANVANFVDSPEQAQARDQWAADFARDLDQGLGAQYVNFVAKERDGEGRVAYPAATRDRLQAVKEQYDPDNLFSRWYLGDGRSGR
jgi:FAD/FMN-containing dehydrogenase